MTFDLDDLMAAALQAADIAAELVRTQTPGVLTAKGDRDYTSEVDYAIEQKIRAFLHESAPDVGFLGEEEGLTGGNWERRWVLDPIDGTVNFAHQIPLCGISLALIDNQRPVLAVIDLPMLGARYTGMDGRGAFRDGRRISVRSIRRLDDAVVAMGDFAVGPGSAERNRRQLNLARYLADRVLRLRMLGSAALDLAWLADGKLDATVAFSNNPWDMAAGVLIAREAGAEVFDANGMEHTSDSLATIAAAASLAPSIRSIVSRINPE